MASRRRSYDPGDDRDVDPPADPYAFTREIALRALDRRAYSRAELGDYLRRKAAPDETIEQVLARLEELKLIDDRAFAQMWINSRHQSRNLSKRVLALELKRKGVADEIVTDLLAQLDVDDEYEAALRAARQKSHHLGSVDYHVALRRIVGMLARKGYSSQMCYRVAREVIDSQQEDTK